jgi:MYXO-CTERM domain-containing protein
MAFDRGARRCGAMVLGALVGVVFPAEGSALAAGTSHAVPGFVGRHVDRFGRTVQDMCPAELRGDTEARCYGKYLLPDALPAAGTLPVGLGATDIAAAYSLPAATKSGGAIVALVDAYSYPTALADLNTYRAQYSLGTLAACTGLPTAGGAACLAVVNQTGGSTPPGADPTGGWPSEMALDMAMVSAACPDCSIVLVQATTENNSDLDAAVDYAATIPGVVAISNSYGWPETGKGTPFSNADASHYVHPGILIAAASGDQDYDDQGEDGTGPSFPASAPTVLGVGGTVLSLAGTTWSETVWNDGVQQGGAEGGGSGCSAHFSRPSFQSALSTGTCAAAWRASVDVSAAADYNAGKTGGGILIYQSPMAATGGGHGGGGGGGGGATAGGWEQVVGTSAATPMVAAIFARLGIASQVGASIGFVYTNAAAFHDIADGSTNDSTGACTDVMCTAGPGWDGPTGVGTPNGAAIAALGMGSGSSSSGSGSGSSSGGSASGSSGSGSGSGASGSGSSSSGGSGSGSSSGSKSGSSTSSGSGSSSGNASSGGAIGSGVSGSSSGGHGADGGSVDETASFDNQAPSGCGCTTAGSSPLNPSALLAVSGAAFAFASRRRRRWEVSRARLGEEPSREEGRRTR